MAKVTLQPPYENIVMEYPVAIHGREEPAVRITNTATGEIEDWFGPYARSLGRALTLVSKERHEDLEEHQDQ